MSEADPLPLKTGKTEFPVGLGRLLEGSELIVWNPKPSAFRGESEELVEVQRTGYEPS